MFSGGLPSPLIFLNRDFRGECFMLKKFGNYSLGLLPYALKLSFGVSEKGLEKIFGFLLALLYEITGNKIYFS